MWFLGGVDGYSIKPRIKSAFTAKTRQRAECFDKGFLRDILDFTLIEQVPSNQIQNLVLIAAEQQIERRPVACLDPAHQFLIGILCQLQRFYS